MCVTVDNNYKWPFVTELYIVLSISNSQVAPTNTAHTHLNTDIIMHKTLITS